MIYIFRIPVSFVPQFSQKAAPSTFLYPHSGQNISHSPCYSYFLMISMLARSTSFNLESKFASNSSGLMVPLYQLLLSKYCCSALSLKRLPCLARISFLPILSWSFDIPDTSASVRSTEELFGKNVIFRVLYCLGILCCL